MKSKGPAVSPPASVIRGDAELRRLLETQTFDLRRLDVGGFRRWLDRHAAHWHSDPVFVQRCRIRDLRRAHPQLLVLERQRRRAVAADEASPHGERLGTLEQERWDTDRAIAGLRAALEPADAAKAPSLRSKLAAFQDRREEMQAEWDRLVQASPERQAVLRIDAELRPLRAAIGLDAEEAVLKQLQQQPGRHAGRAGDTFEELARALTREHILPELPPDLCLLRGVTLAAARVEFDQLVVRRPTDAGQPVEVLAAVEVKRNINDLAHGFRLRQENLAWLTGDAAGYDPQMYRTGRFRAGHFDRDAVHVQENETFLFRRESFSRFRHDAGIVPFLDGLYFIVRVGTMWGVSGAALARIRSRVSTDERWQPDDDAYLDRLLRWCQSLAAPVETPDVLRLVAAPPERARRVIVVGRY